MAADHDFTFTTAAANICGNSADLIHDIQDNGTTSPVAGQVKTIEGIVVGDFQVTGTEFSGFFVQEEDADADTDDTTSEGIFVYDNGFGVAVAPGDKVRVRGTVSEWISGGTTLTELGAITSVVVCESGLDVTAAAVILPAAGATAFEAYEGMKVVFAQELTVTGNYTLGRYGEVDLSSGGRLWQPTNVVDPARPP